MSWGFHFLFFREIRKSISQWSEFLPRDFCAIWREFFDVTVMTDLKKFIASHCFDVERGASLQSPLSLLYSIDNVVEHDGEEIRTKQTQY